MPINPNVPAPCEFQAFGYITQYIASLCSMFGQESWWYTLALQIKKAHQTFYEDGEDGTDLSELPFFNPK